MKKRIAVLIGALLILCISFTSTVAVFEIENFWGLIDNDTLTPLNETWNVSIGKNDTTTYKFYINGSFYANSLFGDGGGLTNIGYWNKIGNTVALKDVTDNVNIGENKSTDYKLKVNGTSFFNDTLIVSTIANISVEKETDWWDINWSYYRKVTIESDYIGSNLNNFPLLVVINSTIGAKCDDGNSIRFLSTDNSTEFYYEIELWNTSNDSFVWVKVSEVLTSDSDYAFLLYYNNSDAFDNQNPSAVWDSNFMAVWHMNSLLDSTINDIDLTNDGCDADAIGKIGDCYTWNVTNTDNMYHPTFLDVMPVSDEITFESWSNRVVEDDNYNIFAKSNIEGQDRLFFRTVGGFLELFGEGTNGGSRFAVDVDLGGADEWIYMVGMYKSNVALKIIREGIYITTGDSCEHIRDGTDSSFYLGSHLDVEQYFDGRLDEIRVSNIIRSNSWIKATFHTQNQTTSFLTFGSEQEYIPEYDYYLNRTDLLTVDTNSLQINFTGVINLHNDSRVRRHVRVTAPSWKKGVTAPTDAQIGIFPVYSFDKTSDDTVYYSLMIPYRIEAGSEIAVNIDWCYTGANDVGTVHWNMSYINVHTGESVDGSLSHIEKTSTGYHTSGKLVRTYLTGNIEGAVEHDILGLRLIRDISEDTLDTDAHMIQVHLEFIVDKLGEPI